MKTFLTSLMSLLMTFASALAVNYNLTTFQPDETLTDDQLVEIDTISNGAELTLKIRINGVKVELANPEDSTYSIRLPKFGVATAKGSADVPRGLFYLPVPAGLNHAVVRSVEIDTVCHYLKLAPAQRLLPVGAFESYPSTKNQSAFVRLAEKGNLLNNHCVGIVVSPVGYDIGNAEISIPQNLVVTLGFDSIELAPDSSNEPPIIASEKRLESDSVNNLKKALRTSTDINLLDSLSRFRGMPIYIIFSPSPIFDEAAMKLRDWKRRIGYNAIFINSADLNQIENPAPSDLIIRSCKFLYTGLSDRWNIGPDTLPDEFINFLIFGDYNLASSFEYTFPDYIGDSNELPSFYKSITSDMYGATNGGDWYGSDDIMAYSSIGRIPCATSLQANSAVSKIIAYESKLLDPSYEQNFVISFASEFLDANLDDCEDTRWIETLYKWENHIDPIYGCDIPLLLAKKDGVTPLYWNDTRNGGRLPMDLKYKTDWNADTKSITESFTTSDYLFYMGDSPENGSWSLPAFNLFNAMRLDNAENTPLVVSIASFTGRMNASNKMMPQLLFNPNGGMAGGIGISEAVMPSYQTRIFDALATSQWSEQLDGFDFPWENGRVHNVYLGEMNRFVGKYLNTKYPDYMNSYNKQVAMTMHCIGDPTLLLPDAPKMKGEIRVIKSLGECIIQVVDDSDKSYSFVLVSDDGKVKAHYGKSYTTTILANESYHLYVNDFSSIPKYYGVIKGSAKPNPFKLSPINSTNLNMSTGFEYGGMSENENGMIIVSNLQGTNIHKYECNGAESTVYVSFEDYPTGIYKAVLIGEDGKSESITLTK